MMAFQLDWGGHNIILIMDCKESNGLLRHAYGTIDRAPFFLFSHTVAALFVGEFILLVYMNESWTLHTQANHPCIFLDAVFFM